MASTSTCGWPRQPAEHQRRRSRNEPATGAALYQNRKELAAIERKLDRIAGQIAALHTEIAGHDHSDYTGLGELTAKLRALEGENTDLEERWLELSDDPA